MKNSRKIVASLIMSVAMSGAVLAQDGISKDQEVVSAEQAVVASDVTVQDDQVLATQQEAVARTDQDPNASKTPIEMEEVPTVVQNALNESDYEADDVTEVYKVQQSQNTLYEFVIENDGVKWAVHFDERGNYVAKKQVG